MKQKNAIFLALSILILSGCQNAGPAGETATTSPTYQTDPEILEAGPVISDPESDQANSESVSQTEDNSTIESAPATTPGSSENESGKKQDNKNPEGQKETKPTQTEPTEPKETEPSGPLETNPPESEPKETTPPETQPLETEPLATEPPTAEPPEREPEPEPEATDPAAVEITYEFKRQVASYAVQYINAYRSSPCTVLSGMSQVAQYRASQLTWNYGHSTADKRAALAYYEYGRFVDATEFGDDASNSYWEADSAEAICAGFYGTDSEAMGKKIADLIRNSSGHWSYISSSEYSYIGVGVEYREGSEYGWYCCVMVGSVDYG